MLVLSRKCDEQIVIGDDIVITLVSVKGKQVKIGIEAPKDIKVLRGELRDDFDWFAPAEVSSELLLAESS